MVNMQGAKDLNCLEWKVIDDSTAIAFFFAYTV
uniref:Uncharacterized protein n=1 Tax=Arundo donax TaxID=35708 RepID=A0A0A9FII2_ARUDO